jgi:peptide deformylase
MAVREILKMGDPRLLRIAPPVMQFDTDELHWLITDLLDTMHAASGAGLAAPQIGVNLQVVIFGTSAPNPRYPEAPLVPRTVLINPVITPLAALEVDDWEGCLSVPGLRGKVPRWNHIRYAGFDQLPTVLITGGVHGYETSGVHGALHFADAHAERYAGRANLLVVPCVSPWAYERIQRWNFDAIDPNRIVPCRQPGAGVCRADATGGHVARPVGRPHRLARNHRHRRVGVSPGAGRPRWQAV